MQYICLVYSNTVFLSIRVNTHVSLIIEVFLVFHKSVIIGDFFQLPMAHVHKTGTISMKKRGSILSGVIPSSLLPGLKTA
jgi:hypothetical protein